MSMYKALTIAGSDTTGSAGLQADLKTFQERDVYGMSVLTTIITQDPQNEWAPRVFPVDLSVVEAQLTTVFDGIGVDAVKTGMLGSVELVELVARKLAQYHCDRVVVDPALVCKRTGEVLMPDQAAALREMLLPRALIVTPNLIEAAQLADRPPILTLDDMKDAAVRIHELGARNVLIKGGDKLESETAIDLFYDGTHFNTLEAEVTPTENTHGAGCTTSAAITAELAKGAKLEEAVHTAKAFVSLAIRYGFALNRYVGPTMQSALRRYG